MAFEYMVCVAVIILKEVFAAESRHVSLGLESENTRDYTAMMTAALKVKLYSIGIDENLVLDWNFGIGDKDVLYLKYCPTTELILPPSDDEYIPYADMYKQ